MFDGKNSAARASQAVPGRAGVTCRLAPVYISPLTLYGFLRDFYRPERSSGQVMFLHLSFSHSVHGGCIPACNGADPPFRHLPWADPFPQADVPLANTPLVRHPSEQTLPWADSPLCIQACIGADTRRLEYILVHKNFRKIP